MRLHFFDPQEGGARARVPISKHDLLGRQELCKHSVVAASTSATTRREGAFRTTAVERPSAAINVCGGRCHSSRTVRGKGGGGGPGRGSERGRSGTLRIKRVECAERCARSLMPAA